MKFYNLFDDGSYSQMALIATIKLIGVLFLSGCSGNIDIVCVIVLVSLIKESVEQQMYVNYVHFQGVWKIPSYKYSGKKVRDARVRYIHVPTTTDGSVLYDVN